MHTLHHDARSRPEHNNSERPTSDCVSASSPSCASPSTPVAVHVLLRRFFSFVTNHAYRLAPPGPTALNHLPSCSPLLTIHFPNVPPNLLRPGTSHLYLASRRSTEPPSVIAPTSTYNVRPPQHLTRLCPIRSSVPDPPMPIGIFLDMCLCASSVACLGCALVGRLCPSFLSHHLPCAHQAVPN